MSNSLLTSYQPVARYEKREVILLRDALYPLVKMWHSIPPEKHGGSNGISQCSSVFEAGLAAREDDGEAKPAQLYRGST